MIPSIRTFLLINLLLSITLITSLIIIANLFLGHQEIQRYMDAQLIAKTINLQDLIPGYLQNQMALKQLQLHINKEHYKKHDVLFKKKFYAYTQTEFQVWDQTGKPILHSPHMVTINPSSLTEGFTDRWFDGEKWRIYTLKNTERGILSVVAEKYGQRETLEARITRDSVLIVLMGYPFLSLLIWIIVGQGLNSLNKIAIEVGNRELGYLEPVNVAAVPTEIKPLINELNNLFLRLNEAYAREKRFAADAAHELRTPLAGLKAQAQVALKATDEKERKEALRKVVAGVNRSAHVVQQLLIMSRMLPEANQGEPVRLNLSKQAAEVIADLVPDALAKNTEIDLDAPESLTPIKGYPTAINILIRNLVDNAIRYTPEGSSVNVIVTEDPENVILEVIDNGPGIPKELQDRVFERFFRVLGNKTTGSGLGLSIVQQTAALHHAHIALDTPPSGKGLRVTVRFPKTFSKIQ